MPAPERDFPERRDESPPMLDYQGPAPHWVRARRQRMMGVLGALLSAGSAIGVVFILIISGIVGRGPGRLLVPGICAACATIVLGGIAFWQWKQRGSTAFAAGVLIGLGVAALIEGLCFAVLYQN